MVRFLRVLVGVGALLGAQLAIDGIPVQIVPAEAGRPALDYELERTGRGGYELRIRGAGPVPEVELQRVLELGLADPIRRPQAAEGPRERIDLRPLANAGTYKLVLPGYQPFGLLNLGR